MVASERHPFNKRLVLSGSSLFCFPSSLLAGRGGEEQGEGSSDTGVSLFLSGSPRRSGDAESLPSILLPAFGAGRGVGANSLLLLELLWSVANSSAWMRLSLPLWPADTSQTYL
jgi:hypothetical protein